jgi:hypothetical protein
MVTKLHALYDVRELDDESLCGDLLLPPEASGLKCPDAYDGKTTTWQLFVENLQGD